MSARFKFGGVIQGSVTIKDGETEHEAMYRAERTIQDALDTHCHRFFDVNDEGDRISLSPTIGLEDPR